MRYILLTFFLGLQLHLHAQKGDYLLTHYSPDIAGLDNVNFDIAVDNNGMLSLANRSGLIQFDGHNWDYIATPIAMLSVDIDQDNVVYAGGVNDIGYFGFLDQNFQFISLAGEEEFEDLFYETLVMGNQVFFLGETKIVRFDLEEQSTQIIDQPDDDFFLTIFEMDGAIYAQTESKIFVVNDQELEETNLKLPDDAQVQFVAKHPNREEYLFGSTFNQLYLLRDSKFSPMKVSDEISAMDYFAYDGSWISDDLLAISTLEAGCVIVDMARDKVVSMINYNSGLPDNEVTAMIADYENGLWMAHEYGLSRIVPEIPILSYSNYPGMTGNLLSAAIHDGRTYVSTSSGVYYFDQEKRYRNNIYYTVEQIRKKSTKQPPPKKAVTAPTPQKKKKKPALGGLFKKKKSKEQVKTDGDSDEKKGFFGRIATKIGEQLSGEVKTIKGKPDKNTRYVRRVKRELISTRDLYKKVDGLDFKTKQLLHFNDRLLAISNTGLYEVHDSVANLVIDDAIRYAYANDQYVLLATNNNEIRIFELLEDLWIESQSFELSGEIIVSIFSDHQDRIWVVSSNSIYQLDPTGANQQQMIYAEIPNQFIDKVRGTVINDKIYLVNSSGYFFYDEEEQKVKSDSILLEKLGKPLHHLQQSDGTIWVYDGKSWTSIGADKALTTYRLLGLFPDMTFIDLIGDELWVIDQNEELVRFKPEEGQEITHKNRMFIRTVRNQAGKVKKSEKIEFDFDDNSITIELSRPDYLGISQVEYQYKLTGRMANWSEWTDNNKIDFNYLPPGQYSLTARSRDAFGEVQGSEEFNFSIDPPYWQTPWFYAIQIIIFASLVIGSARLNRGENKGKYALLTKGLTLFTIILIIEFLQTIAGSYLGIKSSPVFDFLIDATIAMFIFPIEIFLRKLIHSGAEVKHLKKMIKPGEAG